MKISIFKNNHTNAHGQLLTANGFNEALFSQSIATNCSLVAIGDEEEEGLLPAVTWASYFPSGNRNIKSPQPSGLFPLMIGDLESASKTWSSIIGRREELGIVLAFKHPTDCKLLLIARCREDFPKTKAVEINQRWLADQLNVGKPEIDGDAHRAYPLYSYSLQLFQGGDIFEEGEQMAYDYEEEEPQVEDAKPKPEAPVEEKPQLEEDQPQPENPTNEVAPSDTPNYQTTFKGIPLKSIAEEWIKNNIGEPSEGEYTHTIYQAAYRLRHICEYQPIPIFHAVPHYNLPDEAIMDECAKACRASRSSMPFDLQYIIESFNKADPDNEEEAEAEEVDYISNAEDSLAAFLDTSELPPLPPVIKQFTEIAPPGFDRPTILCLLPVLGTLGSRLRARFLDDDLHSPSFMACLTGKMGKGKSYLRRVVNRCLNDVKILDKIGRAEEKRYDEVYGKLKKTSAKINKKTLEELPDKPQAIIRVVPPTISKTKLFPRLEAAQGLHLFTFAEEIDTVRKAQRNGFSNITDLLRNGFDNSEAGQDYASDTSYSGVVDIFYNVLYSGTPDACKALFNKENQNNGFASRFIFAELPNYKFKGYPKWGHFTAKQNMIVSQGLERLNDITINSYTDVEKDGNERVVYEACPEHIMNMPWLCSYIEKWEEDLLEKACRADSEIHDDLYPRPAVMGFRAGMLAWFLYGEKKSKKVKEDVCKFAVWVANSTLNALVDNLDLISVRGPKISFAEVYYRLPDEFDRDQLEEALNKAGIGTKSSPVISIWRNKENCITSDRKYNAQHFKKIKV